MVKAVIVEDNPLIQNEISSLLKQHFPQIELKGIADSVESAETLILQSTPDLLLLDVELKNNKTTFDLLKKLDIKKYHIVFITTYQEFAMKAFQYSAIDYLLKPIDDAIFIEGINKVIQKEKLETHKKMRVLFDNLATENAQQRKIVLKTQEEIFVLYIKDIIRIESENSYSIFFTVKGKKIVTSTSIKAYENLLTEKLGFFRAHQSHLINGFHINSYKKNNDIIEMQNNEKVPLASRKRKLFIDFMESL